MKKDKVFYWASSNRNKTTRAGKEFKNFEKAKKWSEEEIRKGAGESGVLEMVK